MKKKKTTFERRVEKFLDFMDEYDLWQFEHNNDRDLWRERLSNFLREAKVRRSTRNFITKRGWSKAGGGLSKGWGDSFVRDMVNIVDAFAKKEVNVRLQDIKHKHD